MEKPSKKIFKTLRLSINELGLLGMNSDVVL